MNLPRIVIGLIIFSIGMVIPVVGFLPMLVGGYLLSRMFVDNYNIPLFFFLGILVLIPSFFWIVPLFGHMGVGGGDVVRYTMCLIGSVMTWLSVGK